MNPLFEKQSKLAVLVRKRLIVVGSSFIPETDSETDSSLLVELSRCIPINGDDVRALR